MFQLMICPLSASTDRRLTARGPASIVSLMKRIGLLAIALTVALAATSAQAASHDFWKLGYRPVDPFASASPLERTIDRAQRFLVKVRGRFVVRANPNQEPVRLYLPLPPDDAYQQVYVSRLRPAPARVLTSRYGFSIAEFDFGPLPAGRQLTIKYDAAVSVGKIRWRIDPSQVGTLDEIPARIRADYLSDGPFYGLGDPLIARAAAEAVGDERHPFRMMMGILRYVRRNVVYVLDGRKVDAATTLQFGHGSCTEQTFLMIAMARRLGLPARYMAGSFVKTSPFTRDHYDRVNHKIVEIYLPRVGWVPVESTGARRRAQYNPGELIGESGHRMLFFVHEPEPGLAPLDPRRNIITQRPYGIGSRLKVDRDEVTSWTRD